MKKVLHARKLLLLLSLFTVTTAWSQQRYLNEVFTSVNVTSNVRYGNNISILTGSPTATDLLMDMYEPAGDSLTLRPLVIYLHTGSFLPAVFNQNPTGGKTDSTAVEM